MNRKITWIRHGQSDWNAQGRWQGHTDTLLSDRGKEQALALSKRLKNSKFDAIYSSDLERALHTCRLALPSGEVQIDPRLREINFGIYEGNHWDGLTAGERNLVGEWWADPYRCKLEGGESMECVQSRVNQFFDELPPSCEIAVFTHGGVIRNAIWQVVGKPSGGTWSVQIENTSLTVMEYTQAKSVIHKINDHAHLDPA